MIHWNEKLHGLEYKAMEIAEKAQMQAGKNISECLWIFNLE